MESLSLAELQATAERHGCLVVRKGPQAPEQAMAQGSDEDGELAILPPGSELVFDRIRRADRWFGLVPQYAVVAYCRTSGNGVHVEINLNGWKRHLLLLAFAVVVPGAIVYEALFADRGVDSWGVVAVVCAMSVLPFLLVSVPWMRRLGKSLRMYGRVLAEVAHGSGHAGPRSTGGGIA